MVRTERLPPSLPHRLGVIPRHEILHQVLSDGLVSHWLSTGFSPPEEFPRIIIDLTLVDTLDKLLWRTEIKEKRRCSPSEILVIIIWVEAITGRIVKRNFYPWLKEEELRELTYSRE
jgi:hypothetical protein